MRFRLSPYSTQIMQHPVFKREQRALKGWISSPERLRRLNRVLLLAVLALVLFGWLALAVLFSIDLGNRVTGYGLSHNFYESATALIWLIIAASIGATALLDMTSIRSTLNSISSEVVTGRWQLLRLTLLSTGGIVSAKHHIAQLRVWRLTFALVCLRLAVVMLLLLLTLVLPYIAYGYNYAVMDFLYLIQTEPESAGLVLLIIVLTLTVYVIEPLWRVKAVTALGMAISAYAFDIPLATLLAVLVVFAMWVLQIMVVAALTLGLGAGFNIFIMQAILDVNVSNFAWLLYFLLCGLILTVTIYGFYAILQAWGLRRSLTRLTRIN